MRLLISLILAVCCLFSITVSAQKTKTGKSKPKAAKASGKTKFIPPKIVKDEEVKDLPPDLVEDVYISDNKYVNVAPTVSDYSKDISYNAPEITAFDKGKHYLISLKPSSPGYYYYKLGIQDSSGNIILPPVFSEIENIGVGIKIKMGNLSGLLDNSFQTILPMEYESILPIKGTEWLLVKGGGILDSRIIDKNGVQQVPGLYSNMSTIAVNDGNEPNSYLLFTNTNYKKAIYDTKNLRFISDFNIKYVSKLNNGFIIVTDTYSYLADRNMNRITDDNFDNIATASSSQELMIVTKGKKKGLVSVAGNYILRCEYDTLDRIGSYYSQLPIFIAKKDEKYVCIDHTGKNLLGATYDYIKNSPYESNTLLIKSGKKMGIKDILNHTIIPIEFDTIYNVNNKYLTQQGSKFTEYTTAGERLNDIACEKVEILTYDYKAYYLNNKVGLMNNNFDHITEPIYDKIEYFTNNFLSYINDYGETQFKVTQKGKVGIITKFNRIILPVAYDGIFKINHKVYLLKQNGKYGLMTTSDNKVIASCKYDYIGNDSYDDTKFNAIEGKIVTNFTVN